MRVCLLVDTHLQQWQIEALRSLLKETDAALSLVVVNEDSLADSDEATVRSTSGVDASDIQLFLKKVRDTGAWAFVLAEQKMVSLLKKDRRQYWLNVPIDEVDLIEDVPRIDCRPITDGNWNSLPPDVVDRIDQEADVVIRFGFGLIQGEILDATAYGVLSFHPADIRKYRGWSKARTFLNDDEYIAVTLQQLNEDIDGGKIITVNKQQLPTDPTLAQVFNEAADLQAETLPEGIKELQRPSFEPEEPDVLGTYMPLSNRRQVRYSGRILLKDIYRELKSIFK